jgi:hypothetical protein
MGIGAEGADIKGGSTALTGSTGRSEFFLAGIIFS